MLICLTVFWLKDCSRSAKHFVAFAAIAAVYMFGAGLEHHLLDIYFHRGEAMGTKWGDKNAGWMFAWLLVSFNALGKSALLAMAVSFTECGNVVSKVAIVSYVFAYGAVAVTVVLEVVILIGENTDFTGTIGTYMSIVALFTSLVVAAVEMFKTKADFKNGCFTAGMSLMLASYTFIAFMIPKPCREVVRKDCLFPDDFNHNALFHVGIIFANLVLFAALATRSNHVQTDGCAGNTAVQEEGAKPAVIGDVSC